MPSSTWEWKASLAFLGGSLMSPQSLCRSLLVWVLLLGWPAPAPAADLALDYRQVSLKNGMRLITLEDFNCPIVAVQIWFHVGSKDELPERQGFAHMFEHMMFR